MSKYPACHVEPVGYQLVTIVWSLEPKLPPLAQLPMPGACDGPVKVVGVSQDGACTIGVMASQPVHSQLWTSR